MTAGSNLPVSVIIPTHHRATSLRRTLDALAAQTYPADGMEVIVAADGCIDTTLAMAREYQWRSGLRVLELDGAGAGAARNRGAAEARGRRLVFLDEDIEPSSRLVEAHVATHLDGIEKVSIGPSLLALNGHLDFFRMELRAWWTDFFEAMLISGYRFTFHSLAAGKCAIERTLFARTRGFDSAIGSSVGEDWEFGVRLLKAGVPFRYVHMAQARHFVGSDLTQSLRRKRQEGRAEVIIGRRHPESRSGLRLARRVLGGVFATSDAAAMTGKVAPAELATESQICFELQYGGMGHGFTRRMFKKPELSTDGLLWASGYGVGTNMAFRREVFASSGRFDTGVAGVFARCWVRS